MKKLVAIPLAVLFAAACSESTAPATSADLAVRSGKAVTPPTELPLGGTVVQDLFDFNADISASAAEWSGTGISTTGLSTTSFSIPITPKPSNASDRFVGRLNDYTLNLTPSNLSAGGEYSLAFNLYLIGSWDGLGRQAQQGIFGADIWALAYTCNGGAPITLYQTTFSNQKTVQQSYPDQYPSPGGHKAGLESVDQNDLGYTPAEVNVPLFDSFTNTNYRMVFAGKNQCAAGQTMTFVMTVPNALQPGNYDESWGIDNVDLRVRNPVI